MTGHGLGCPVLVSDDSDIEESSPLAAAVATSATSRARTTASAAPTGSASSTSTAPLQVASTGMELASDPRPPLSAALTAAANRRPRPLKWGGHIHDQELLKNGTAVRRALCPYIFRSGKNQGQLWLVCSDWWRDRRCWHKQPFDMSNFKYLPTWQQDWLDGNASILSSYAPCSRHLDLKPCCDLKLLRPRTMHATRTSFNDLTTALKRGARP